MYVLCEYTTIVIVLFFFFQAEDGIRDLVRSRGLGDVYKRQAKSTQMKTNLFEKASLVAHEIITILLD